MFRLKALRLEGLCCYATRMLLSLMVLRSANKRLDAHFRMATVLNTRMNILLHLFSCGEISVTYKHCLLDSTRRNRIVA